MPCPECMRRLPSGKLVVKKGKNRQPIDFCQGCGDERFILKQYKPFKDKQAETMAEKNVL